MDVLETVVAAQGGRVVLDVVYSVVVIAILFLVSRGRPLIMVAGLAVFIAWIVGLEYGGVQTIHRRGCEVVVRNAHSRLSPGVLPRFFSSIPVILSGVVQTVNRARGDNTYELTRTLATAIVAGQHRDIVYRDLLSRHAPLPRKFIVVCQHYRYMLETLSFLALIPRGYRIRVLNHVGRGVVSRVLTTYGPNLYGLHPINLSDPSGIRPQINRFVFHMLTDSAPTVYCIWPSGRAWDPSLPNGVEQFRPGAFFMSCFTRMPVCIVHGRASEDMGRYVIVRGGLMQPPAIPTSGKDYNSFYGDVQTHAPVLAFRDHVEGEYRKLDRELEEEVISPH